LLNEAFLRFCAGPARNARRVFLLGDVFEQWIGDDIGLAAYPREIAALKALPEQGVQVAYQTGNRDFLLGDRFATATGARALSDEAVVTLADGLPTLLAHGDRYCTDDLGYQRWRRFSRQPLAQSLFLRLPAAWRARIAGGVRTQSNDAKQAKPLMIMDVNPEAIRDALERHGVRRMIHGHTHRPAKHQHDSSNGTAERIVLADWRPAHIEWLQVGADQTQRLQLH
jgi:UDP-2,3-diacylglucosamine hydrolase